MVSPVPPTNVWAFAMDHAFPEPVTVIPDCPVRFTEPPPWETVNTPAARAPVELAKISSVTVPGMWQTPPALSIGTGAELEYSWASPVLTRERPVPAENVCRFEIVWVSTAALLVTMPIPAEATNVGKIGVTKAAVLPIVVPVQSWKDRFVGLYMYTVFPCPSLQ